MKNTEKEEIRSLLRSLMKTHLKQSQPMTALYDLDELLESADLTKIPEEYKSVLKDRLHALLKGMHAQQQSTKQIFETLNPEQ